MKTCTKCSQPKTQRADGKWRCRPCENAYQREHYANNPSLYQERKRNDMRRLRQIPERREAMNAARRGNPRYIQKNREYGQRLRERHFFRWRARCQANGVTAQQLASLWKKQRGRCALSGLKLGRDAHLDHIVPLSRNGSGGIDNLRWLDPWVNIARQNLADEEFAKRCSQVAEYIGRLILQAEAEMEEPR